MSCCECFSFISRLIFYDFKFTAIFHNFFLTLSTFLCGIKWFKQKIFKALNKKRSLGKLYFHGIAYQTTIKIINKTSWNVISFPAHSRAVVLNVGCELICRKKRSMKTNNYQDDNKLCTKQNCQKNDRLISRRLFFTLHHIFVQNVV